MIEVIDEWECLKPCSDKEVMKCVTTAMDKAVSFIGKEPRLECTTKSVAGAWGGKYSGWNYNPSRQAFVKKNDEWKQVVSAGCESIEAPRIRMQLLIDKDQFDRVAKSHLASKSTDGLAECFDLKVAAR